MFCFCFYICVFFDNIQSLIRGIEKLVQQRKEQCVVEYGKTLAILFNIFLDPRYHQVKVTNDEMII